MDHSLKPGDCPGRSLELQPLVCRSAQHLLLAEGSRQEHVARSHCSVCRRAADAASVYERGLLRRCERTQLERVAVMPYGRLVWEAAGCRLVCNAFKAGGTTRQGDQRKSLCCCLS
eukprot:3976504-Prymnesium_polylepis.1